MQRRVVVRKIDGSTRVLPVGPMHRIGQIVYLDVVALRTNRDGTPTSVCSIDSTVHVVRGRTQSKEDGGGYLYVLSPLFRLDLLSTGHPEHLLFPVGYEELVQLREVFEAKMLMIEEAIDYCTAGRDDTLGDASDGSDGSDGSDSDYSDDAGDGEEPLSGRNDGWS